MVLQSLFFVLGFNLKMTLSDFLGQNKLTVFSDFDFFAIYKRGKVILKKNQLL